MEIFEICAHLENMLHHIIGLGTYRTYIGEAIKELRIYQQRLEYEDSCGYRNELDLMRDHAKDLEDENATLKEANERFHTELRLATKYVRETRTKLRRAQHNLWKSEDDVASLTEENTKLKNRITELIRDRDAIVEHWTKHCENLFHEHRKCLAAKDREIYYWRELAKKIADQNGSDISSCYPKNLINNPCNFCGNCKHYAQMGKDDDEYEGICVQHYIKRVDPDDASCEHFQSNQVDNVDNVIIGKPEFPCCNGCNREDCDDCTLCPF